MTIEFVLSGLFSRRLFSPSWQSAGRQPAGPALERLETEWTEYPVLRLDLNAETYNSMKGLYAIIDLHLQRWEQRYPRRRYKSIPPLHEEYKQFPKPFFGVLKSSDAHLKFAFITGVTKFGPDARSSSTRSVRPDQVSVFSDMNQLIDLSLHGEYAALCGITEEALAQINDKDYLIPFSAKTGTGRKLSKIGVEFDKETRNIGRWITVEGP